MSKFIEKLNSFSKKTVPAMGFRRPAEAVKQPAMLVAVEFSAKSDDDLKALAEAGAAAIIIDTVGLTATTLSKCVKSCGEATIGLVISSAKYAAGAKLMSPDVDFIVIDLNMPVKAFDQKEFETAGKVLAVDTGLEAALMRATNELYPGVNAVMIDLRAAPLTLDQLAKCRKTAEFSGQHVLAQVARALTKAELTALRDCGVKSLVLPPDTSASDIARIVAGIEELPAPEKKKERGGVALVPRIEPQAAEPEGEGEDDE